MKLVSKKDFAELAGVSRPAISKAVRQGRIPVTADGAIDADAKECKAYLSAKSKRVKAKAKRPRPKKKPTAPKVDEVASAADRLTLERRKLAAQTQQIELKNAQIEGRLVAREVMISGVWNPLETFLVRILTDGAKTMAATVHPLVKSDGTREEVEVALRQELTSFIVPLKESIQRALKLDKNG